MSVDIVSLVYEADARQLTDAEKAFDRLTAAAARNDAAERKRLTATERAGVTMRRATDETVRATRAATDHARAQGAVEKAAREADRAAQQSLAFRMRMNAQAVREAVSAAKAQAAAQTAADRDAERSAQQLLQFRMRMARQRAQEEVQAVREATIAQAKADRESERSAQQLLQFRVRMARQRAAEEARAAQEQAAAVASLEGRIDALKGSIDPTYTAQRRLNAEMKEAAALYKLGAISASDYAQATSVLDQRMDAVLRGQRTLVGVHGQAVKSSGQLRQATFSLGQQFADVGVSLAGGINPLMVLIQQGPQIQTALSQMKAEGVGAGAALRGALGPIAGILGPVIIGAGAAAAGFALLNRELSKDDPENFAASLGLTEEQLKRVDDASITMGDTFKATINVMADYLTSGPIGDAIDWIGEKWTAWLDDFAKNTAHELAVVYGVIIGTGRTIVQNWGSFGAALSDGFAVQINKMIDSVQEFVNATVKGLNLIMPFLNPALAGVRLPEANLSGFKLPVSGAARFIGMALGSNVQNATAEGERGLANIGSRIAAERKAVAEERIRKEAGDANKTPQGRAAPRDMTDERTAQIAGQVERAMADELQARLALVTDVSARADLEKDIVMRELAAKQFAVEKQIADINDPKTRLDQATKDALTDQLRTVQALNASAGAAEMEAIDRDKAQKLTRNEIELADARRQNAIDAMEASASTLRSSYAQAVADVAILKAKQEQERIEQQRIVDLYERYKADSGFTAEQAQIAHDRIETLKKVHAAELELAERSTTLAEALRAAQNDVRDFKDAFARRDWGAMIDAFISAIQTATAAAGSFKGVGAVATIGTMAGGLIGGKTGRTISKVGGNIAGGIISGGALIDAASMGVFGNGALAGSMMGLSSLLPYVGIVAGLVSLAKAFQKPSNKGAGYDLITGEISGKSRDEETTNAVTQAAQAIQQMQDTLKASGLSNLDEIRGLVIGSRDASQIYTASGKTVTSAKGDPAAAAEAAFAAMLDGATYVSDTQRKLVESMRAAGKGFDDIATALQGYAAAQQMVTAVNDEILRMTDAQAYDLLVQKRANEEQLKAAQAAYDAGYLTADQLNELNAALARLNGLQIDEVMARYGGDEIANLTDQLRTAFEAESSALREHAAEFQRFADSLSAYSDQIRGAMVETLSPGQQLGIASRRFQNVASLAAQGDKGALGQFQGVAETFRQASAQYSPDAATNRRNLAAIQRATQDAYDAAKEQVDFAEAQLAVLQNQVAPFLGDIRNGTLSVVELLKLLNAKLMSKGGGGAVDTVQAAVEALAAQGPTAAASDAFNAAAYLAQNPDVAASGMDPYEHYIRTGQYEIAGGYRQRGFATGGSFRVGGSGGEDSQFMPLWLTPGEMVDVRRPGQAANDDGRTAAAIERQNALIAENNSLLKQVLKETRDGTSVLKGAQDGVRPLKTTAAA